MAKKAKTRSAAKKRFSYTGSGKIKYQKNGRRHLLSTKSSKRQRRLRKAGILANAKEKAVRLMMPNG